MRVVSIGVPIVDLLADPNCPAAFDYSVEFCGGTHLLNSGHMRRLVVLSEEAIAKGVRRMIAVTGGEADRAHKRAEVLAKECDQLSASVSGQLATGKVNVTVVMRQIIEVNNRFVFIF